MFRKFYPTISCESAYSVDFRTLYEKGYRGLLTDVDNTLVEHGAPADERSEALFIMLHDLGFQTCIISNNHENRVAPFAERTRSLYVCDAGKPKVWGYRKGMELMGTTPSETVFMGDQLFTDIFGANRTGIPSILVRPIRLDHKPLILLKRAGEVIVKVFYRIYASRHCDSL
ncbi:MAG: HAD hydrolase-like protein [Parasporobacterium sp.]|nr:HAD hydrolase-like protein [Parasporobacterium sp.]